MILVTNTYSSRIAGLFTMDVLLLAVLLIMMAIYTILYACLGLNRVLLEQYSLRKGAVAVLSSCLDVRCWWDGERTEMLLSMIPVH